MCPLPSIVLDLLLPLSPPPSPRRFHVEELVLLVLLLFCGSARKGKRNLHAVMCSYRKKSYDGSQMCLDISSSELHENNAWPVGT
uniref:Uncharacterized protein n=1 Tax=Setaria italica TaxID=4555 RepID=K3ZKM7_SETIT